MPSTHFKHTREHLSAWSTDHNYLDQHFLHLMMEVTGSKVPETRCTVLIPQCETALRMKMTDQLSV